MISINVKEICKTFKNQSVLENISFQANAGELIGIVGGNGCGKSTLMNILAGVIKCDSGSVEYLFPDNPPPKKNSGQKVAYVPQENYLLKELSVYDNLLFWYQGDKQKLENDLAKDLATSLEINEYRNKKVGKLSLGMQKRVAFFCALASQPKILLLDEIGSPLDIVSRIKIQQYLTKYTHEGNIVIMITHDQGDANICNRILHIKEKKIVEEKTLLLTEIFGEHL